MRIPNAGCSSPRNSRIRIGRVGTSANLARIRRTLPCRAYEGEAGRDLEAVSVAPGHLGLQEPEPSCILTRRKEFEGRELPGSYAVELLFRREPSNIRAVVDGGGPKARRLKRVDDRPNGREPFPIDGQEAWKGLFQDAEATGGHVRGRDDDSMRHPCDVTQGRAVVAEMMEHHDDHREVEGVCPEREVVAIALHTLERTFLAGDPEHGVRRIEGHDAIRRREELGKSAGPGSEVQHALPVSQPSDLDESAEPELAVHRLVGTNAIVVRGMPRIVDGHKTCKRRAAYEASGGGRGPSGDYASP